MFFTFKIFMLLVPTLLTFIIFYRLKSVTPQHFISSQKKLLMRTLKMNLGKDVNLISLQDAPQGNLDILLFVRGVSLKLLNLNLHQKQYHLLNSIF